MADFHRYLIPASGAHVSTTFPLGDDWELLDEPAYDSNGDPLPPTYPQPTRSAQEPEEAEE